MEMFTYNASYCIALVIFYDVIVLLFRLSLNA